MKFPARCRALGWLSFASFAVVSPIVAADSEPANAPAPFVCASAVGEKKTCEADTSRGVTLVKSLGPGACELGRTWGWDEKSVWVSEGCSGEFAVGRAEEKHWAKYVALSGFRVGSSEHGDLNIRVFTYIRYLNQDRLEDSYTNAFGVTSNVQQRQDIQVNKAQVYFHGWVMSPKLRYLLYVWSSNASQGLSAQVVVAGNVGYQFNDHVRVVAGIGGLPGTRTTSGTFPFWLPVDFRQVADEFFRPSYTTGIWVEGKIVDDLNYQMMVGNNLSQLGVDAGQLDDDLDTWSGVLAWMPTTGEYGKPDGLGDFEGHDEVATRAAIHYTRSDENRQSQPNTDAFENVQVRVSDGSVIFTPDLFGPGIQIDDAMYRMAALDLGIKYRGWALEGELYRRRIDDFRGPGTASLPFENLDDHGFQVFGSWMALPQSLQVYAGGSKVYGEYGDPWDWRVGANWFPWKNQVVRWNFEYARFHRSPVGGLSVPYPVGADGGVFQSNFMIWF